MRPDIRKILPSELEEVEALVRAAGLPTEGLPETELFVLRSDGGVAGVVGFEAYPPYVLLRSLLVAPAFRRRGFGGVLLSFIEAEARRRGLLAAYALTTTIPGRLRREGFEPVGRDEVPAELHVSAELQGACPTSAAVFRKSLA